MLLFDHDSVLCMRGAWFLACPRYCAQQVAGRVLSAYEAVALIESPLRGASNASLRRLYARQHVGAPWSTGRQLVSDSEKRRWLVNELDGRRLGGLVLIELSALPQGQDPPSEARRIVRAVAAALGRDELRHGAARYRLALAEERGPYRDAFEVLHPENAVALLASMTADTRYSASLRELLKQASALFSPTQPPGRDRVVLLRRCIVGREAGETDKPPVVPARYKKARETAWLDVELVDEDGLPLADERFLVEPTGSGTRTGRLDERGRVYIEQLVPGSCKLSFPRFVPVGA